MLHSEREADSTNTEILSDGVLRAWNDAPPRSLSLRLRWPTLLLAIACLGWFIAFTFTPYRTNRLRVFLLEPTSAETPQAVGYQDVEAMEVLLLARQARQAFQVFSSEANLLTTIAGLSDQASAEIIRHASKTIPGSALGRNDVAVICGAGLLSTAPHGCILSASSKHAKEGRGLQLAAFISELADRQNAPVIVCIDVLPHRPQNYVCSSPVEVLQQCRAELEDALRRHPSASVAVLLSPRDYDSSVGMAGIATLAANALATQAGQRTPLASLTDSLASSSHEGGEWIFSPGWQSRSGHLAAVPFTATAQDSLAAPDEVEPQTKTQSVASATDTLARLAALDNHQRSASLSSLPVSALHDLCCTIRDRWLQEDQLQPFHPSPTTCPQAWNQMERFLAATGRFIAVDVSQELQQDLLVAARAMLQIDQPNPNNASPLLRELSPGLAWLGSIQRSASELRLANTSALPAEIWQKLQALELSLQDEDQLRRLIDSWSTSEVPAAGFEWATHLLDLQDIDWPTRRDFLRTKAAALRAAFQPPLLAINLPDYSEAQTAYLDSFRLLVLRNQKDWHAKAAEQNQVAFHKFTRCQQYGSATQQALGASMQIAMHFAQWDCLTQPSELSKADSDQLNVAMQQSIELCDLLQENLADNASAIEQLAGQLKQSVDRLHAECSLLPPTSAANTTASHSSTAVAPSQMLSRGQIQIRAIRLRTALALLAKITHTPVAPAMSAAIAALQQAAAKANVRNVVDAQTHVSLALRSQLPEFGESLLHGENDCLVKPIAASLIASLGHLNADLDLQLAKQLARQQATLGLQRASTLMNSLAGIPPQIAVIARDELDTWDRRLQTLGQPSIPTPEQTLRLLAPTAIAVHNDAAHELPLSISNHSESTKRFTLTIEYAPSELQLTSAEAISKPGIVEFQAEVRASESKVLKTALSQHASGKSMRPVLVSLRTDKLHSSQLIEIQGNDADFVSAQLLNQANASLADDFGNASLLLANRVNSLALAVANLRDHPLRIQTRVFSAPIPAASCPTGTLSKEDADEWLARNDLPLLCSSPAATALRVNSQQKVSLPPIQLAPGAAPMTLQSLLIEFTDLDSNRVQFVQWRPMTLRPAALLEAQLEYTARDRTLRASFTSLSEVGLPNSPVNIVARLLERADLREIRRGQTTAAARHSTQELKFQLDPSAASQELILAVDVDDWPNAFLFSVQPRTHSVTAIPMSQEILGIKVEPRNIAQPLGVFVLGKEAVFVPGEVEVLVGDQAFRPGQDRIVAGIDINHDRYLRDEPQIQLASPILLRSTWRGVDANGHLQIGSEVKKPTVQIPIDAHLSRVVSLQAYVQREEETIWSRSIEFVADREMPSVIRAEPVGQAPLLIGKPLEFHITVDDRGLSGVAAVQGCWSLSGSSEIDSKASLVSAVKLDSQTWSLKLPTEALRSGPSLLLVRATDHSGNVSETHNVFIDCYSATDWAALQRSITTTVEGQVRHGRSELPNFEVTIATEATDSEPAATLQTTRTTRNGNFKFEKIASGKYVITAKGIAKGMKVVRAQNIEVTAPRPPELLEFRLDKPAK